VAHRGEEVLGANLCPRLEEHPQKDGDKCQLAPRLAGVNPVGFNKFLVLSLTDLGLSFVQSFPYAATLVDWAQSEDDYWEVLPQGISKGAALRELVAHLGLSIDAVIAIANYLNDRMMLLAVGWG